MTAPRRKPAPKPVVRQRAQAPDWSTVSYTHIKQRWQELDARTAKAEDGARFWKIVAMLGWVITLVLVLLLLAV